MFSQGQSHKIKNKKILNTILGLFKVGNNTSGKIQKKTFTGKNKSGMMPKKTFPSNNNNNNSNNK